METYNREDSDPIKTLTGMEYIEFSEWLLAAHNKTQTMSGLNELIAEEFKLNIKFSLALLQTIHLQYHFKTDFDFMQSVILDLIIENGLNPFLSFGIDGYREQIGIKKEKVAISIHELEDDYTLLPVPHEQYKLASNFGIRLIHVFEPIFWDPDKFRILKNIIMHACGKTQKRIYARDCEVVVKKALELKQFFNENNIQGYRGAKTAFCLAHKKTKEILMAYSVGHAHFGKGLYDAEIARGACKLGYSVVGGASKLWKFIIDYYKDKNIDGSPGSVKSIVYYVDLNYYDGKSLRMLEGQEIIQEQPGFWNYWVETMQLKNREPHRHKFIMEAQKKGLLFPVPNAGVQTNVWFRDSDNPVRLDLLKRRKSTNK